MFATPPKKILVPTDHSDAAESALDYAIAFAKSVGAEVTVLHAYDIPLAAFPEGIPVDTADLVTALVNAARESLAACVTKRKDCGVKVTPILKPGDARDVIHEVAAEIGADLIVMGTHGRRGIARALLGSVAENVVRMADRPVLTVRAGK